MNCIEFSSLVGCEASFLSKYRQNQRLVALNATTLYPSGVSNQSIDDRYIASKRSDVRQQRFSERSQER
jgi:hypothetical protein